jgi:hypothetical protein
LFDNQVSDQFSPDPGARRLNQLARYSRMAGSAEETILGTETKFLPLQSEHGLRKDSFSALAGLFRSDGTIGVETEYFGL